MNTRIKELIQQAEETYTYKDFDGDGFEEIKQSKTVNLEKFAELIINECSDLCTKEYRTVDGWGFTGADVRCAKLIKEHFGVE